MKKFVFVFLILVLAGCSHMNQSNKNRSIASADDAPEFVTPADCDLLLYVGENPKAEKVSELVAYFESDAVKEKGYNGKVTVINFSMKGHSHESDVNVEYLGQEKLYLVLSFQLYNRRRGLRPSEQKFIIIADDFDEVTAKLPQCKRDGRLG